MGQLLQVKGWSWLIIGSLVAAGLGFGACERAVALDSVNEVAPILGRCIEISSPMFLIKRTDDGIRFSELTRQALVRSGSVFAPMSIEDFARGRGPSSPLAEVIQVVPAQTRLEILHVWRLKAFEGDTLAATGSIGLEGERLEAEVSEIFDEEWALALANGSISQEERDELSGRPMLDGTYAKLCARI